jgi:purine-binding chemotaxis protein CheW
LNTTLFERNPPTLERNWAMFSRGIFRLDGRLLVILDVARLLDYALQG